MSASPIFNPRYGKQIITLMVKQFSVTYYFTGRFWLQGADLNPRPSGYECDYVGNTYL